MLDEVELLVARGSPEIFPCVGNLVCMTFPFCADNGETTLFPKGRIRQDYVNLLRFRFKTITNRNYRWL